MKSLVKYRPLARFGRRCAASAAPWSSAATRRGATCGICRWRSPGVRSRAVAIWSPGFLMGWWVDGLMGWWFWMICWMICWIIFVILMSFGAFLDGFDEFQICLIHFRFGCSVNTWENFEKCGKSHLFSKYVGGKKLSNNSRGAWISHNIIFDKCSQNGLTLFWLPSLVDASLCYDNWGYVYRAPLRQDRVIQPRSMCGRPGIKGTINIWYCIGISDHEFSCIMMEMM